MIYLQIVIERKSIDPVAVTAEETLRTRFGLDSVLEGVERRRLAELAVDGAELNATTDRVERYLRDTFSFWNPNRERAWMRAAARAREEEARESDRGAVDANASIVEIGRGAVARLGTTDLASSENGQDHLVVWTRGEDAMPGDLRPVVASMRADADFREAECYSFSWRDAPEDAVRRERTSALAAVRSRHEGFFVHPHFQEHQTIHGRLPLPVWSRAADLTSPTNAR